MKPRCFRDSVTTVGFCVDDGKPSCAAYNWVIMRPGELVSPYWIDFGKCVDIATARISHGGGMLSAGFYRISVLWWVYASQSPIPTI